MTEQLDNFRQALKEFGDLKDGWDGYDTPAPTKNIICKTDLFLVYIKENYSCLKPSMIGPSVDGSIVVSFLAPGIWTNVEFYEEETFAVIAKDGQPMEIWEVEDIDKAIQKIIEAITK